MSRAPDQFRLSNFGLVPQRGRDGDVGSKPWSPACKSCRCALLRTIEPAAPRPFAGAWKSIGSPHTNRPCAIPTIRSACRSGPLHWRCPAPNCRDHRRCQGRQDRALRAGQQVEIAGVLATVLVRHVGDRGATNLVAGSSGRKSDSIIGTGPFFVKMLARRSRMRRHRVGASRRRPLPRPTRQGRYEAPGTAVAYRVSLDKHTSWLSSIVHLRAFRSVLAMRHCSADDMQRPENPHGSRSNR